jgi:hypothetical protein
VGWRQCLEWRTHVGTICRWLSKGYKNLAYYSRMASCISPPKFLRLSQAKKEIFLHLQTQDGCKLKYYKVQVNARPRAQGVAN